MNCEYIAKSNAREINDIWHGLYYYCPECGRQIVLDPDAYGEEEHPCPFCEEDGEHCEMEEYDLYEWLGDQLGISEWRFTDRHGPVSSVLVCLGWGGPNVYLDTKTETVKVYWGCDYAEAPVERGACEEINRLTCEDWDCQ